MDKKYWDKFYKNNGKMDDIIQCSTFAHFCLEKFFNQGVKNIVELGSGNGRDAIYFARHALNTIAIDQSIIAIAIEKEELDDSVSKYLHPRALNFVSEDYFHYDSIDIFYSRFTIHAITKKDEEELLPKIYKALNKGGLFCVEARTTKDPLYGVGEYCGDNTYITDHKRRFINSEKFISTVLSLGFKLLYFTEEDDLSVCKNDNPVLMRIVLEK